MKIMKLHNCTVLEIETTNDAFTCGVIASKQEGVSLDMQDYGLKGIRIVDGVLLNALCGGGVYLAKGQVANTTPQRMARPSAGATYAGGDCSEGNGNG